MVINSTLWQFHFCPFCEFQIIEVLPHSFPSLWPVCVNVAGLQKWGEEVVMTALSARGEEFLCGAVRNGLCARVQFNLGWVRVQSCCDWHPQEPPCKAGKLKLLSGLSANYQPLFWEIAPIWSKKNVSIISFSWGLRGSSSLDLSEVARGNVVWTETKEWASEAVSTLISAFWDWAPWKVMAVGHRLRTSKETEHFFAIC